MSDHPRLVDQEGTVSETSRANILLIKDKRVIRPLSPHVLPGVMEKVVCEHLLQWGYEVREQKVLPEDMFFFDEVFLTNSLMGVVPVLHLDHKKLNESTGLHLKINQAVLSP